MLLAAGDTFRAAASEQLEAWAERSGASIHTAANDKQRPDGVLFQAVDKAKQVSKAVIKASVTFYPRQNADHAYPVANGLYEILYQGRFTVHPSGAGSFGRFKPESCLGLKDRAQPESLRTSCAQVCESFVIQSGYRAGGHAVDLLKPPHIFH